MVSKNDKRTSIRWDEDNFNYINNIVKKYYRNPRFNLNKYINHLVRKDRTNVRKGKSEASNLKEDILELAKKRDRIEERMRNKQILLYAKKKD